MGSSADPEGRPKLRGKAREQTGPVSHHEVEGHGGFEELGCLGEVNLVGGGHDGDPTALCLHHVAA